MLSADELSDVLQLQPPEIHPAEAFDRSLGELSIPCRRGDGDGVLRSPRMVPYRSIERRWLARPMPGQEAFLAVLRHLLHAIELVGKQLGVAACALALTDCPEVLLPAFESKNTPDVASSLFLLVLRVPNVRLLNGPLRAAEGSGARRPLGVSGRSAGVAGYIRPEIRSNCPIFFAERWPSG
jgi:hypothetical protein